MKSPTTTRTALGVALMASALMACSDRAKEDGSEAAHDAATTAEKVGDVAQDVGRDVAGAATDAAQSAKDTVETLDVKAALIIDSRVDASGIDVDTDQTTKLVVLKGHVPTADQKALAERIAVDKAVGYRVRNELTVGR